MTSRFDVRDYQVVSPGNADLAGDLRKQFEVSQPFQVELATTIVPVVSVDLSDADGSVANEHHFILGTDTTPAAAQFPWSIVQNVGQGVLVLEAVRASHQTNELHIRRTLQGGIISETAGVVHYTNTKPASSGVSIKSRISGGGITDPSIVIKIANEPSAVLWFELGDGYVLHPGDFIALMGMGSGTRMTCAWRGREFE